jgi:hypothetical protein
VRINTLDLERVFQGRDDEDEHLIKGAVENVEVSEDATNEEDDAGNSPPTNLAASAC